MKVNAYDKEGRTWEIEVEISNPHGKRLLSFGYPMIYSLDDPEYGLMRGYPFDKDLCIDGNGRNNHGSPVYVKKEDINQILKEMI